MDRMCLLRSRMFGQIRIFASPNPSFFFFFFYPGCDRRRFASSTPRRQRSRLCRRHIDPTNRPETTTLQIASLRGGSPINSDSDEETRKVRTFSNFFFLNKSSTKVRTYCANAEVENKLTPPGGERICNVWWLYRFIASQQYKLTKAFKARTFACIWRKHR